MAINWSSIAEQVLSSAQSCKDRKASFYLRQQLSATGALGIYCVGSSKSNSRPDGNNKIGELEISYIKHLCQPWREIGGVGGMTL